MPSKDRIQGISKQADEVTRLMQSNIDQTLDRQATIDRLDVNSKILEEGTRKVRVCCSCVVTELLRLIDVRTIAEATVYVLQGAHQDVLAHVVPHCGRDCAGVMGKRGFRRQGRPLRAS